jgi:hypothetical protein
MTDNQIYINFFPLLEQFFPIPVYIKPCLDQTTKTISFLPIKVKRYRLPLEKNEEYNFYFVSFDSFNGSTKTDVYSSDNKDLTNLYLLKLLKEKLDKLNYPYKIKENFEIRIDFILKKLSEGNEVISILPAYNNNQFGYIFDFRFKKNEISHFDKKIQILSLSLNKNGFSNKDYYYDKYQKIYSFIQSFGQKIFNPLDEEGNIYISRDLTSFGQGRLEAKKYVFKNAMVENSQFKGISTFGPYKQYNDNPVLFFIFRNKEKQISYDLYHALQGKTYPTFSGMEKMFGFQMNADTVQGIGVDDYTLLNIESLINDIKTKTGNRKPLPLVIVPWINDTATDEQHELYYTMKHHFLKNDMPSQFAGISKINNYNALKWSVSSIGLQIFSKLGGNPWKMYTNNADCLIIGIGQSYKINDEKHIERYFSYSILTDTSGIFQNINVLSDEVTEESYLNTLSVKLKELLYNQKGKYKTIVLHTSFRIGEKEIKVINNTVSVFSSSENMDVFVLRFNEDHYYMGYNTSSNTKTPYESSFVKLNKKECLVWFEGLSSVNNTIKSRIGPPIRIIVDYPKNIETKDIKSYLQDALNLSGANWRGFNSKTIPISILYTRLVSSFLRGFDTYNLERINIEKMVPWFL